MDCDVRMQRPVEASRNRCETTTLDVSVDRLGLRSRIVKESSGLERASCDRLLQFADDRLSILGIIPGIRVAAPRDGARLREELGEELAVNDGPTALRFP